MITYKLTDQDEANCQAIAHCPQDEVKKFVKHRRHMASLYLTSRTWNAEISEYEYHPADVSDHNQWMAAMHNAIASRVQQLSLGCDDYKPTAKRNRFERET